MMVMMLKANHPSIANGRFRQASNQIGTSEHTTIALISISFALIKQRKKEEEDEVAEWT